MPVVCPIDFPRINDDEMRSIDYKVMEHAFATHNELGRLADETIYHHRLLHCLQSHGIEAVTEVPIELSFGRFAIPLAMDLVVAGKVIYELKTASALLPAHESQLLDYMFLTNTTHGKLVNFRTRSVNSKFVNTTLTANERRQFDFCTLRYAGDRCLPDLAFDLVADWGTGLNAAFYRRALLRCSEGEYESEQLLPMSSGRQRIGNQRFHLLDSASALGVTTFKETTNENLIDFQKLISASTLHRFHWLNITHHQVTLSTIQRERPF